MAPPLGEIPSLDAEVEQRILSTFQIKGVKLNKLEAFERIVLLGNLLHAYDQSWQLSGVPIVLGSQVRISDEDKKEVNANDKKNKAAIRSLLNRMDIGHLVAGVRLDDPKKLTRLIAALVDKMETLLRGKLVLNVRQIIQKQNRLSTCNPRISTRVSTASSFASEIASEVSAALEKENKKTATPDDLSQRVPPSKGNQIPRTPIKPPEATFKTPQVIVTNIEYSSPPPSKPLLFKATPKVVQEERYPKFTPSPELGERVRSRNNLARRSKSVSPRSFKLPNAEEKQVIPSGKQILRTPSISVPEPVEENNESIVSTLSTASQNTIPSGKDLPRTPPDAEVSEQEQEQEQADSVLMKAPMAIPIKVVAPATPEVSSSLSVPRKNVIPGGRELARTPTVSEAEIMERKASRPSGLYQMTPVAHAEGLELAPKPPTPSPVVVVPAVVAEEKKKKSATDKVESSPVKLLKSLTKNRAPLPSKQILKGKALDKSPARNKTVSPAVAKTPTPSPKPTPTPSPTLLKNKAVAKSPAASPRLIKNKAASPAVAKTPPKPTPSPRLKPLASLTKARAPTPTRRKPSKQLLRTAAEAQPESSPAKPKKSILIEDDVSLLSPLTKNRAVTPNRRKPSRPKKQQNKEEDDQHPSLNSTFTVEASKESPKVQDAADLKGLSPIKVGEKKKKKIVISRGTVKTKAVVDVVQKAAPVTVAAPIKTPEPVVPKRLGFKRVTKKKEMVVDDAVKATEPEVRQKRGALKNAVKVNTPEAAAPPVEKKKSKASQKVAKTAAVKPATPELKSSPKTVVAQKTSSRAAKKVSPVVPEPAAKRATRAPVKTSEPIKRAAKAPVKVVSEASRKAPARTTPEPTNQRAEATSKPGKRVSKAPARASPQTAKASAKLTPNPSPPMKAAPPKRATKEPALAKTTVKPNAKVTKEPELPPSKKPTLTRQSTRSKCVVKEVEPSKKKEASKEENENENKKSGKKRKAAAEINDSGRKKERKPSKLPVPSPRAVGKTPSPDLLNPNAVKGPRRNSAIPVRTPATPVAGVKRAAAAAVPAARRMTHAAAAAAASNAHAPPAKKQKLDGQLDVTIEEKVDQISMPATARLKLGDDVYLTPKRNINIKRTRQLPSAATATKVVDSIKDEFYNTPAAPPRRRETRSRK